MWDKALVMCEDQFSTLGREVGIKLRHSDMVEDVYFTLTERYVGGRGRGVLLSACRKLQGRARRVVRRSSSAQRWHHSCRYLLLPSNPSWMVWVGQRHWHELYSAFLTSL